MRKDNRSIGLRVPRPEKAPTFPMYKPPHALIYMNVGLDGEPDMMECTCGQIYTGSVCKINMHGHCVDGKVNTDTREILKKFETAKRMRELGLA